MLGFIQQLPKGIVALLVWTGASLSLAAQPLGDNLRYAGNYQLEELQGQAEYFYQLDGGDTVRQGSFRMQGTDLQALLSGGDSQFSFLGAFEEGRPQGEWQLEFGNYTASGAAELVGFQYHLEVTGIQHRAFGTITDGKLDSTWIHEVRRVAQSQPTELSFRSEITFAEGVPQQSFRIESGEEMLLGRFRRDGEAHDTWTLYSDMQARENWYFRAGRLESIEILEEGDTTKVEVFATAGQRAESMNLDARYFELIAIWLDIHDWQYPVGGGGVAGLLSDNAEYYEKVRSVFTGLGSSDLGAVLKVSVPSFPLSGKETRDLQAIKTDLQRIDTTLQSVTTNTSFAIIENVDPEAGSLRATLRKIDNDVLPPVRQLVAAYDRDILSYLPRDRYYAKLWPAGSASDLSAIKALTSSTFQTVDSVRLALNRKLNTKERRQVLSALEEQLSHEYSLLDSLVASYDNKIAKKYGLKRVTEVVDQELREYTAIEDVVTQQARAGDLIACVQEMDALAVTLAEFPDRSEEIKEIYTDQVWNNFTATIMEEELKKPITEAYLDHLIPYFQAQIKNSLTCNNASSLNQQINTVYNRLLELRKEETSDLEDNLKDLDDPRKILDLINSSVQ